MPEPRQPMDISGVKIPMVQKWYDDAMEGNITNPFMRTDIGDDLDLKEEFIFQKALPLFEPDPERRELLRLQWSGDRDRAGQAPAPPTPTEAPLMDDLLKEAMGQSGASGVNYQQ